jgi:hypothetical protein
MLGRNIMVLARYAYGGMPCHSSKSNVLAVLEFTFNEFYFVERVVAFGMIHHVCTTKDKDLYWCRRMPLLSLAMTK